MMDYLTSMKQMNSLILESVDIQDQRFILEKESEELSSKLDDVVVPTLKTNEYTKSELEEKLDEIDDALINSNCVNVEEAEETKKQYESEIEKLVEYGGTSEKDADVVQEGLKQARENVGSDSCWDGYKADGTKIKDGKEVPNCVDEDELNESGGAAGTSEEDVDSIMGNAETLPENLGMKNSLSAKPNLSESVIDEKPMNDAKEGSNIELKTIEHLNDVFIKEYQPQANIKYDLDGTELKPVVNSDPYKLPRGW